MDPYVHIHLNVLDGRRIWLSMTIMDYEKNEVDVHCNWNNKHRDEKRVIYKRDTDMRCFHCVPWGNMTTSSEFVRVGRLIATI
jgi:hypothetical protein